MSTIVQYTCEFFDPKLFDGTTPVNPGQQWQFMKETCTYNTGMYAPTTTISSSTSIQVYGSFTAGEVFMALLMFILIVIELFKMLTRALDRIKTKKKYLGYSTSEVEVKEEL
jgi:hypothetical protein